MFNFRLDHQAAILVFQPFTENDAVKNCYLTKIEVTSDNDITNTYTLDTTSGELTGSGSGKTITVTTKGDGSYAQGFPLKTSAANVATNGTYVVIRPGTHALTVRYWIKDYVTQVEGAVTKTYPAFNYEKNDYYDMTANLNVTDYDGRKYYMWDAKNNFWNGHEWNSTKPLQPVLKGGTYTQTGDGNFYNNERPGGSKAAMYSCKDLPSANVMAWYVKEGDPHWDGGEVWTTMGHLYKGGMWFKKKLYIPQFSANKAPNPINTDIASLSSDYTLNANPAQGTPTAKALYFFVPALGQYSWNSFGGLGTDGYYWTSSGSNEDGNWAYFL